MKNGRKRWCFQAAALLVAGAFTLGLSGCGQAAAPADPVSKTQETEHTQEGAPLRILSEGDEEGRYSCEYSYGQERNRLAYLDFESSQQLPLCAAPSCTHAEEGCTAWVPPGASTSVLILDEDRLLLRIVERRPEEQVTLYLADRDGGNRRQLGETIPGYMGYQVIEQANMRLGYLADDSYFYYIQQTPAEERKTLARISLETGKTEECFVLNETMEDSNILLGVRGRDLIWSHIQWDTPEMPQIPEGVSGDEEKKLVEEALRTQEEETDIGTQLILQNIDTQEKTEMKSWQTQADEIPDFCWDADSGRIYWVSASHPDALNWLTPEGENGTVSLQWPSNVDITNDCWARLEQMAGGRLLVSLSQNLSEKESWSSRYAISPKDGSCTEITLSCFGNGRNYPVPILQTTQTGLLLETALEQKQVMTHGTDGEAYMGDAYLSQLGMLPYEAFFASSQEYQQIQMLDALA